MRDAVICEPVRTAIGGYGGMFRDVPAHTLAATVIRALLERTGVDAEEVDDVILGQCYPNGEAPAIGRVAALDAGLDIATPGIQIDRRCGSGLQAVLTAAMQVAIGVSDVVIAGGAVLAQVVRDDLHDRASLRPHPMRTLSRCRRSGGRGSARPAMPAGRRRDSRPR